MRKIFRKTIFTGFGPNITPSTLITALSFLCLSWQWRQWRSGEAVQEVEQALETYFGVPHAITFDSGRSGLFFALQSLGIGPGDEVLVQAYTCVVVTNAIRWTGATAVFVDIRHDFTPDPISIEKHISRQTKAIIIQHTFGFAADLTTILAIVKKYQLRVIEDCAHSFGGIYHEKKLGTFGDIGMLSFGTDKILSCVRGGALITADETLAAKIRKYREALPFPPRRVVAQALLFFPIFSLGKYVYRLGIGKIFLGLCKMLHITPRIITTQEKKGGVDSRYPARLPHALASILLQDLKEVDERNRHRQNIAAIYEKKLLPFGLIPASVQSLDHGNVPIYLRFPLLVPNATQLSHKLKQQGIIVGDWYSTVIAPKDIDPTATSYQPGQCPNAEHAAKHSINLPTHHAVSEEDALVIANAVIHALQT